MQRADFKNLRVLVLGLGVQGGGLAVTQWLLKQGAKVTVSDLKTRRELKDSLFKLTGQPIKYVLGRHPLSLLKECDLIVQNPGVPRDLALLKQARRQGIKIENEVTLFLKLCPSRRLIAVTGSKGKSTTASLLGQLLKSTWPKTVVAGNIKDNLLFKVLDQLKPTTPVVLELSSWQLELVREQGLRLAQAIITNLLPDHLNRYRSMNDYISAKVGIFIGQRAEDNLVLNYDNLPSRRLLQQAKGRVYWFSLKRPVRGAYCNHGVIYWQSGKKPQKVIKVTELNLPGEHNLANVLAAVSGACLFGVSISKIRTTLPQFKGLHDRLQQIRVWHGRRFYNDTTATAPVATEAALRALSGQPIVLIAGGQDKSLPYGGLASLIAQQNVKVVLLPGSATDKLVKLLPSRVRFKRACNMVQAVRIAARWAPSKGIVILSPAAASFGLFKHEFDRGQRFVAAVRALK